MPPDLSRSLTAQRDVYLQALAEVRAGRNPDTRKSRTYRTIAQSYVHPAASMMTLIAMLMLAAAIGPIVWLARAPTGGILQWLVASAAAVAVSGSALIVGPWVLVSLYLRSAMLAGLVAAVVATALRTLRASGGPQGSDMSWRRLATQSSVACLFGLVLLDGCAGKVAPSQATDLHFPLENGTYAVLQGGNSLVLNSSHHWFPSDRYAVDLVKVNRLRNRAHGVAPARLEEYASYGAAVRSPCTGIVAEAVDNVPDNPPGVTDSHHRAGNHLRLRCGALMVLLGHLRRESVTVGKGAEVRRGQLVGRIGNSGFTREPHLHVSAMAADSREPFLQTPGVPITFDGRFLSVNDVVQWPGRASPAHP